MDTAARPVCPGCFKTENADSSNTAELLEAGLFLCWCVVKVRKLPIVSDNLHFQELSSRQLSNFD